MKTNKNDETNEIRMLTKNIILMGGATINWAMRTHQLAFK
jgi:hypothetical protein